ncbi:MAG: hypothetical protein EXR62_07875 [Chloroflexi bacterium]|nr:hypothetical protein [Chloroflexota bacterium]
MARTDRGTNPPDTPTTLRDAAQQRSNCRLAWRRLAQPGEFASKVLVIPPELAQGPAAQSYVFIDVATGPIASHDYWRNSQVLHMIADTLRP